MSWFFIADEHYWHDKVRLYAKRPFSTVEEMNQTLIDAHNSIVKPGDITVHGGDFSFGNKAKAEAILKQLNGNHVLIRGSHDGWMNGSYHERWEKTIEDLHLVVDHYPARSWPKSHYGSCQLHGHCHGGMDPIGKQWDIGVDNKRTAIIVPDYISWAPLNFEQIKRIMMGQEETPRHHPDGASEDDDGQSDD